MIQQSKSLSPKDMHSHVYCSVIHNSQDIDIIRVSVFRWTDKENMTYMPNGILFNFKREGNTAIFDNMNEPWGDYTKWNKPDTERQILYVITYMWAFLKA